ncbi:cell division protein FtsL [Maricaulis maris]|uniref:cell division protein FtsL n=1 Tax=Maricaulis maris TaxID=74318 RepID=UPI003B8D382F
MIRTLNAIAFVVAAALAVALYIAKAEAKSSQERLEDIQAQLVEERRQINVLNVEIAHLEDPERLRALARRYLGFEPLDPSREVDLSDLPLLADARPENEGVRRDQALVRQEEGALAMAEPTRVGGPD